ncbi:hypothetical protein JVU11DRAFT_4353 [Chiua virens]|nr:hypothetical protein JVU11DRAFT_4353 [Chiua virens]
MQLSNDIAALIGFAAEAVLWGVNVTLFGTSLFILRHRPIQDTIRNPVILLNSLIFLCCTAHFALEYNHFYTTLSTIGVQNYSNETTQLMGADLLISITDLLGDCALIYRCWMLWGKNYYVAMLPLLLAVGGFTCIVALLILLIYTNPAAPAPPAALVPLGLAGYILPLCTNFIVTFLIIYRIHATSYSVSDSPLQVGQGATRHAMTLIIESGALYLLFQLVFVILFSISSPAEAILAVMAVQVYGIAPTLIIMRVGLGVSSEFSETAVSTRIKWFSRREETGTSATGYTDGLIAHTDLEGTRESDFSKSEHHDHDTPLKVFEYSTPHRAEGIAI